MALHQYEEYVNSIVTNLFKDKSIGNPTVELSPGSKKGDNYVGEMIKASITHGSLKESWIFKLAKNDQKLRESFDTAKMFNREIYCYEKLFPALDSLQDELKIEGEDRFNHAKCFYSNQEKYFEVIVMEDLTPKGYATINRTDTFTWEMLQLTIKTMANLHTLSFFLKAKKPEEFKRFADELEWSCPTHQFEIMEQSMKQCKELITDKTHKEIFEKFLPDLRQKIKNSLERTTPFGIIVQGDSWIKNMMFKFENNKPVGLILVDWQVCRLCSPVVDLFVVFFMNTSSEVRRQYMKKALDLYYDHLTKRLQTLGLDIENSYPRRIFEEDVKSYSTFGIIVGMMASSFIHAEEGLEITQMNKEGADFKHSPKSIQQMNDILADSIEFGLM